MDKELTSIGLYRWLLWGNYKARYLDGYIYGQLSHHYRHRQENKDISGHFNQQPADKEYIDFTGKKLHVVECDTGEVVGLHRYVGLRWSKYAEALHTQQKEEFICATEKALHYFGGVPGALMPDK